MNISRTSISFFCALFILSHQSIAQNKLDRSIMFFAEYSNMSFTEEHQYGYEVQLWNEGSSLIGYLFHSDGLIGDVPIGVLENVNYDKKNGNISFESKLTMGLHYCNIHNGIPSHEIYRFNGVLSKSHLFGEMLAINMLDQGIISNKEKVDLLLTKASGEHDHAAITRVEWNERASRILKARSSHW